VASGPWLEKKSGGWVGGEGELAAREEQSLVEGNEWLARGEEGIDVPRATRSRGPATRH